MYWISQHRPEIASLVLIACGVWWLMPGTVRLPKIVGLVLAICVAGWLATRLNPASGHGVPTVLFFTFAAGAILSAILMITNRNPVYSALWFALVTLSVCGLFLLQSAPFLAAATVIVYAGAIVVTFVFVIMLAQQSGATVYDQRSRQPFFATVLAVLLLAALLGTLETASPDDFHFADAHPTAMAANALSHPAQNEQLDPTEKKRLDTMLGLGRSLFGDYLFAVELAGTLLLVATIGAIAIAPRRRRGDSMMGDIESYLAVGAVLFVLGALGFFTRRNLIVMMLSVEMMLHGVSLTLVTFGRVHHSFEGQSFTIFILTVAACEAGLALALVLALYQKSKSLDVEFWTELREPDLPPPMLAEDAGKPPFVPPAPMQFPRLTPAGLVPENLDTHDRTLVDDAASQTAESPTEPPNPKDVIKSVTH